MKKKKIKFQAEVVNGKIIYLPTITAPKGAKPFVREWLEDDGEKI